MKGIQSPLALNDLVGRALIKQLNFLVSALVMIIITVAKNNMLQ
jgi:hypothetical protein